MKIDDDYICDIRRVIENNPVLLNLKDTSIMITGVTGLIGSAVADILFVLNSYYNCKNVLYLAGRSKEKIRKRFDLYNQPFIYVKHELFSEITFDDKIDYIIHCAGICSPRLYLEKPIETLYGNIEGIRAILERVNPKNETRILYVSSSEIYGNNDNVDAFKEEDYGWLDLLNPRSCYPSGKRAAETLCVSYIEERGLDIVIARPGHVYGPIQSDQDDRVSAQFIRDAVLGNKIYMKSLGQQLRSYCFSLDCASGILCILKNGKNGNAYNISNSQSIITIQQFVETIQDIASIEIEYKMPTDREKKAFNQMKNSSLNSEKLESIGWKPVFTPYEGIARAIRYSKRAGIHWNS